MPKIICAECKIIEDVEEAPPPMSRVLCSACKAKPPKRARQPEKFIPRKKHGTRVMLPITCTKCGAVDTLDYMPKGTQLDEVLCRDCANEVFKDRTDWQKVTAEKKKESRPEYPFDCDECGRRDYLPFEPHPDRLYYCNLCRFDHEMPSKDRLQGREAASGKGVFIRRRGDDGAGEAPTTDEPAED